MGDSFDYPYCDDVDKYERFGRIGKGTFGEVFKACHKVSKQEVALKKILMDNEQEGFPITALREIRILSTLKTKRVVNLIEVCRSTETNIKPISYLVFEFCHHDLAGLIQEAHDKIKHPANIKCIMKQLLEGLFGLHHNNILHRDMKSSNILITKDGELKIADFGLARPYSKKLDAKRKYTNRVVTLWYRPPELLLGERNYAGAIDIWGVGCIMSELFSKEPLMKGSSEQNQLLLIADYIGPISPEVWPAVVDLPLYSSLSHVINNGKQRKCLLNKMKRFTHDVNALDLLQQMLTLDPSKRIEADPACDHEYFFTEPYPADIAQLAKSLSSISQSQFEYTSRRRSQNPTANANNYVAPQMVRGSSNHRPISHRPGPSNNDGQLRDQIY